LNETPTLTSDFIVLAQSKGVDENLAFYLVRLLLG